MKNHARIVRPLGGLGVLLAGLTVSSGCTHNYYYGAGCAPGAASVVPGTVQYGSVCDVPTRVNGGVAVSDVPSTVVAGPVLGAARPPRVVVSEPNGGSRFAWRRSDPDAGMVTTRVEGGVEDSTRTR